MKQMRLINVAVWLAMLGCAACAARKNRVTYEFPSAMAEPIKVEYIRMWEKGRVLYEMNCAKCHSQVIKGRTVIPDFSQEKLIGYELRVINPKHESAIPETTVTTEELGYIMTFFTYKKKSK